MRKFISIFLMIFLLSTLSSCTEEKVQTNINTKDGNYVDLSLNTFGEIYDLSNKESLSSIQFYSSETPEKRYNLTSEQFDEIYNNLHELQCRNSSKSKEVKTKNGPDYIVDYVIKKEGEHRRFNIVLGKSYLLVSLIPEDTDIYYHEISEDDYSKLEGLLDTLALNVVKGI